MKILVQILKSILIIAVLTVVTQVGGLVYLLYKPIGAQIKKKTGRGLKSGLIRVSIFSAMMILSSLLIVPPIARQLGRIPLPLMFSEEVPLRPVNVLTVLANRHYVKPELKKAIIRISQKARKYDQEVRITYLDANFPFFDMFPLLPHRSHDDGKKLDIAFLYKDAKSDKRMQGAPTFLGYGHSENPI